MFIPVNIVDAAFDKLSSQPNSISAIWVKVETNRSSFAAQIDALTKGLPIVPIVIRSGFDNPNSVLDELSSLIDDNKTRVNEKLDGVADLQQGIVFVLISSTALNVPQLSSPVSLGEWFPVYGGRTIELSIDNAEEITTALLNCVDSQVGFISAKIYEIEYLLIKRLDTCRVNDKNAFRAFYDLLDLDPSETPDSFIDRCKLQIEQISDPKAYRPSANPNSQGCLIVGRLVLLITGKGTEALRGPAKTLSKALAFNGSVEDVQSMFSILFRPVRHIPEPEIRFVRDLMINLYLGLQYTTAAAHAADYPKQPLSLIQAVSRNLRKALQGHIDVLEKV